MNHVCAIKQDDNSLHCWGDDSQYPFEGNDIPVDLGAAPALCDGGLTLDACGICGGNDACPTMAPSLCPTKMPTNFPTSNPTREPTNMPSSNPTESPFENILDMDEVGLDWTDASTSDFTMRESFPFAAYDSVTDKIYGIHPKTDWTELHFVELDPVSGLIINHGQFDQAYVSTMENAGAAIIGTDYYAAREIAGDGKSYMFHVDLSNNPFVPEFIELDVSQEPVFDSVPEFFGFTSVQNQLYAFGKPDANDWTGAYIFKISPTGVISDALALPAFDAPHYKFGTSCPDTYDYFAFNIDKDDGSHNILHLDLSSGSLTSTFFEWDTSTHGPHLYSAKCSNGKIFGITAPGGTWGNLVKINPSTGFVEESSNIPDLASVQISTLEYQSSTVKNPYMVVMKKDDDSYAIIKSYSSPGSWSLAGYGNCRDENGGTFDAIGTNGAWVNSDEKCNLIVEKYFGTTGFLLGSVWGAPDNCNAEFISGVVGVKASLTLPNGLSQTVHPDWGNKQWWYDITGKSATVWEMVDFSGGSAGGTHCWKYARYTNEIHYLETCSDCTCTNESADGWLDLFGSSVEECATTCSDQGFSHIIHAADGDGNCMCCSSDATSDETNGYRIYAISTNYISTSPTSNPSTHPTVQPSLNPTFHPSVKPTFNPTSCPSNSPSLNPTYVPSRSPTQNPSKSPSLVPTYVPSRSPYAIDIDFEGDYDTIVIDKHAFLQ